MPARIRRRALETPERVALREKRFGIWQEVTWRRYWEQVELAAHGLAALGVEPGDRVAIHSENRPEWLYADVATVALRAMTVGLYPTNPPAEVAYLLADSGAKVLVAEDQEQVDKALEVRDELPALERIVYVEPRGVRTYDDPGLLSWAELLELGRDHRDRHPGLLDERAAQVAADDVVTLIYTSGTTGPPKGAMLTVANVDFAIKVLVDERRLLREPRARRRHPVLPAAVPRGRADRHRVGERRRRHPGPLRRVDRHRPGQPARGPADPVLRRAPHLGEDPGNGRDPDGLGVPAEAGQLPAVDGPGGPDRGRAGRQRRHPHPLDPAALRPRLPVPVPLPAQAARPGSAAASPGRGRPRSPPSCCSGSSGSGWSSTRSTA